MLTKFLITLALIPPILILWFVYSRDVVEKEPVSLIAKVFLLGCVSVIVAMVAELVADGLIGLAFDSRSVAYAVVDNFIGVALIEELCKYGAIRLGVWRNPNFNWTFDAIVYSTTAALGFAAAENVSYALTYMDLSTVLGRAITSIPCHAALGVVMGAFLAYAKYAEVRGDKADCTFFTVMGIACPVLLHGLYDYLLSVNFTGVDFCYLALTIGLDILALIIINRCSKSHDRQIA